MSMQVDTPRRLTGAGRLAVLSVAIHEVQIDSTGVDLRTGRSVVHKGIPVRRGIVGGWSELVIRVCRSFDIHRNHDRACSTIR